MDYEEIYLGGENWAIARVEKFSCPPHKLSEPGRELPIDRASHTKEIKCWPFPVLSFR